MGRITDRFKKENKVAVKTLSFKKNEYDCGVILQDYPLLDWARKTAKIYGVELIEYKINDYCRSKFVFSNMSDLKWEHLVDDFMEKFTYKVHKLKW